MKRKAFLTLVSIFLIILFCQCGKPAAVRQEEALQSSDTGSEGIGDSGRNIVLVSIDTLRADHFTPEHMPLIYDWAKKNTMVYMKARANSTWTRPSHTTMLTGLLESQHGVSYGDSIIPPDITLVQERLKEAGYYCIAATKGGHVGSEAGFARGFDIFREPASSPMSVDAFRELVFREAFDDKGEAFDWAEESLESIHSEPRVFVFVHTALVHQFWVHIFSYEKTIAQEVPKLETRKEIYAEYKKRYNTASLEVLKREYAAAVRRCDKRLFEFLTYLEKKLSDPVIIITSDHGEGFGERYGNYVSRNHGRLPYADQINIPLIVKDHAVGVSDKLVGLDDIAGTILSAAGIKNPLKKSLHADRNTLISQAKPWLKSIAFLTPSQKYVFRFKKGESLQLYADENDTVDLLSEDISKESVRGMSPEIKDQLMGLGYLN